MTDGNEQRQTKIIDEHIAEHVNTPVNIQSQSRTIIRFITLILSLIAVYFVFTEIFHRFKPYSETVTNPLNIDHLQRNITFICGNTVITAYTPISHRRLFPWPWRKNNQNFDKFKQLTAGCHYSDSDTSDPDSLLLESPAECFSREVQKILSESGMKTDEIEKMLIKLESALNSALNSEDRPKKQYIKISNERSTKALLSVTQMVMSATTFVLELSQLSPSAWFKIVHLIGAQAKGGLKIQNWARQDRVDALFNVVEMIAESDSPDPAELESNLKKLNTKPGRWRQMGNVFGQFSGLNAAAALGLLIAGASNPVTLPVALFIFATRAVCNTLDYMHVHDIQTWEDAKKHSKGELKQLEGKLKRMPRAMEDTRQRLMQKIKGNAEKLGDKIKGKAEKLAQAMKLKLLICYIRIVDMSDPNDTQPPTQPPTVYNRHLWGPWATRTE